MEPRFSQIQVAIGVARLFGRLFVREDAEGQRVTGAENFVRLGDDFDFACVQIRVHLIQRPECDPAFELQDRLFRQVGHFLLEGHIRIDHDLSQAVVVPQIEKEDASVVPAILQPTGQAYRLVQMLPSELVTVMGPMGVHGLPLENLDSQSLQFQLGIYEKIWGLTYHFSESLSSAVSLSFSAIKSLFQGPKTRFPGSFAERG